MQRVITSILTTLLSITLLAGCRDANSVTGADPASNSKTPASLVNPQEACAIALTPHTGTTPTDQNIRRIQQLAERAGEPVSYLEQLGWAYIAKARRHSDPGFYTLAEQCAVCMMTKHPHSAESLLLHGHVLHNLHQFQAGEDVARQLVAQRGLSFDYGLLGDVLMEQGRLTEAAEAYQHMMDQKPSPQAYSRAAHLRWLTGDLQGASTLMRMAVSGFRDPEAAAWAQVRLGLYELQAGSVSQAAKRLDAVLVNLPDYAPALMARGRIGLTQETPEAALASLRYAAQLNPLPEYQWLLIDGLRAAGHAAEADDVEMQLMQRGEANDRRTFALYLATTAQHVNTAVRLAEEEILARADVFTVDALAWALHAAGRHQEAWTQMQRAMAVGTQDARLFYHAGIIAASVEQQPQAAHYLAAASTIQQMLLPSERQHLRTTVAVLPQVSSPLHLN
jgi:tetratricopeptide (TPR) repeat protein